MADCFGPYEVHLDPVRTYALWKDWASKGPASAGAKVVAQHLNLLGRYSFTVSVPAVGALRPLRDPDGPELERTATGAGRSLAPGSAVRMVLHAGSKILWQQRSPRSG
ncbi:hypothetical protein [Streptomyces sp. NPDC054849]